MSKRFKIHEGGNNDMLTKTMEDNFKDRLHKLRSRFSVHYYPSFMGGMGTVFLITGLLEKDHLDLSDHNSIRDGWEETGTSLKEAIRKYSESLENLDKK